jgi:hypothetical protein
VPDVAVQRAVVHTLTDFPGYDKISSDHATKLFFAPQGSKTSERIYRVMNKCKPGTHAPAGAASNDVGRAEGVQAEIDPIIVMVKTPVGVSGVIVVATSFDAPNGEKALDQIGVVELGSDKCRVHCRVLLPAATTNGLVFRKGAVGEELTTQGNFVSQVNPTMQHHDGVAEWLIPIADLQSSVELL